MELLGRSLHYRFREFDKQLSLKTVCMVGIQLIERLQHLHSLHIVHRDIKPQNMIFGSGDKQNILYLIDFGVSKRYRDPVTLVHIKNKKKQGFAGNDGFISNEALDAYEHSRKDDMFAAWHILVYLRTKTLPWFLSKKEKGDNETEKILAIRRSMTCEEICEGCEEEFFVYYKYLQGLKFEDEPDYEYLKSLYVKILTDRGMVVDYNDFEWMKKDYNKK